MVRDISFFQLIHQLSEGIVYVRLVPIVIFKNGVGEIGAEADQILVPNNEKVFSFV